MGTLHTYWYFRYLSPPDYIIIFFHFDSALAHKTALLLVLQIFYLVTGKKFLLMVTVLVRLATKDSSIKIFENVDRDEEKSLENHSLLYLAYILIKKLGFSILFIMRENFVLCMKMEIRCLILLCFKIMYFTSVSLYWCFTVVW